MDLFLVLASLLVFIISLSYLVIRLYGHDHETKQRLPPGSFGWPIIGETLQFVYAYKKGLLEKFVLERTEKYGSSVFRTSLQGQKVAVFTGAAANKFLFSNESEFLSYWRHRNSRLLFPTTAVLPIEHDAKKFRKYLGMLFTTGSIQKFISTLDAVSRLQLNHWQQKDEVSVNPLLQQYMISLGCKLFMGVEDMNQISKLLRKFSTFSKGVVALPLNVPSTSLYRAVRAGQELRKEIGSVINQREAELSQGIAFPTDDLLSHILSVSSSDGEAMSLAEIIDKILLLLLGGLESTAGALTFTMKYLAEMPNLYDQVFNEHMEIRRSMQPREVLCWGDIQKMKCTWNFVNEVLRVNPVAPGIFREVKKDIYYDGFVIPQGWKIYWTVGLTPRNCFSDPEKFNPSRFEGSGPPAYAHIPFSLGAHMCPGKEYARLTVLVFLHYLLITFKWSSVLCDEKVKYEMVPCLDKGYPIRLSSI